MRKSVPLYMYMCNLIPRPYSQMSLKVATYMYMYVCHYSCDKIFQAFSLLSFVGFKGHL